ncbi:MAG TPA: ArsA-related P-loop ATPase [Solirubrobacteraceae bacterium]|nr:ArsA-related P-loop ATPase [Solirubrobacteraceae bacterium]
MATLLDGRRVCVCCGSGGVGKTTTAAAIGLGLASEGARVAVVTIDPARRLANALGMPELGNEPRRVSPARLTAGGARVRGELWAMMLDPKRTFDELIERIAPDPERAREIMANRIYRELSTAVSGSQEFTAVAKLHDLALGGRFDVLVLDTPPTRNAIDFLDAPVRLTSFLEGGALRALVRPGGIGMRVVGLGAAPLLGALRRVTGVDLVGEISAFLALLGTMTEEISRRAAAVDRLLREESTAFVIVCSAREESIDEAIWFRRTLAGEGMPLAGAIVNRVHGAVRNGRAAGQSPPAVPAALRPDLAARIAGAISDHQRLAARDALGVERLRAELSPAPVLAVPELDGDVHDVAGLLRVTRRLFSPRAAVSARTAGAVAALGNRRSPA